MLNKGADAQKCGSSSLLKGNKHRIRLSNTSFQCETSACLDCFLHGLSPQSLSTGLWEAVGICRRRLEARFLSNGVGRDCTSSGRALCSPVPPGQSPGRVTSRGVHVGRPSPCNASPPRVSALVSRHVTIHAEFQTPSTATPSATRINPPATRSTGNTAGKLSGLLLLRGS